MRAVWPFGVGRWNGSDGVANRRTAKPPNRPGALPHPSTGSRAASAGPIPAVQQVALPNGMTLLLVENHEQPTLSLSLSFPAGNAYDPAGKEGVAALVAELLTKGTPTRDAEEISATIEGVAAVSARALGTISSRSRPTG